MFMTRFLSLLICTLLVVSAGAAHAAPPVEKQVVPGDREADDSDGDMEADKGSGLPLPRFASLKSDNVYVRTGPSMDYPIKWIYKKEGLPVEIIQEFDAWRKIKDPNGEVGWAHKILLSGHKTGLVISSDPLMVYDNQDKDRPIVKFEKNIIVKIEECQKLMCRVHFAPYKGWVDKKSLWGVYGSDIFN